jgi:hypothetical protein
MKKVRFEEKRELMLSLKESNNGDKDLTLIDYQLIEGCLAVMKVHSLVPQKKRGFNVTLSEQIENLVDLAFNKELALGSPMDPVVLDIKEVDYVIYNFNITYRKAKGVSKKRIHTDKYNVTALDEESAIANLKHRLKKLKETLVSIEAVDKSHYSYQMNDGRTILKRDVIDFVN